MFKSIRKGGRIAAATIGIVAALTPLAAPPAALADGLPTPELEKSYTFKNTTIEALTDDEGNAILRTYQRNDDEDADYSTVGYSVLDLSNGSTKDIKIPKASLESVQTQAGCVTWLDGNNLAIYSVDDQKTSTHPIELKKYAETYVELSTNGKVAAIAYENEDSDLKRIDVYDLEANKMIESYKCGKNDERYLLSNDGKRLYVTSLGDNGSSKLTTIDTSSGSRKTQTIPFTGGKFMVRKAGSDTVYVGGSICDTLAKFDYDGNVESLADGQLFNFAIPYDNFLFAAKISRKNNKADFDSIQYALINDNGKEIEAISPAFKDADDSHYSFRDFSEHGGMTLVSLEKSAASNSKSNSDSEADAEDSKTSISAYLAETGTGQKTKLPIKTENVRELQFIDGDQKIFAAYEDKNDSDKLHIDIYKSNIPHSVIDDVLFFAKNNLPVVIGGGIVLVLVIGGTLIVCVRRRKKRSGVKSDASDKAPKAKKQKLDLRKKKAQPEIVSTASAGSTLQPQAPVSAPKFCRHCGTPLVSEAKFCPKCGHPVE